MKGIAAPDPVRGKLLPGETVAWWGVPRQGIVLRARDGLLIPFSLLWCAIAVTPATASIRGNAPAIFMLVGTVFTLVGLFLVFGRFLLDGWLRRRTTYALTDRRVLIVRSGPLSNLTTLPLDRLPETTLLGRRGGRGTIRFGAAASPFSGAHAAGMGAWVSSLDPTPQFLDIADAQQVFAAIQERTSRPRTA